MPPLVFDLRENAHADVLAHVEKTLGVTLDRGSARFGESGASVGFPSAAGTWVRIERRRDNRYDDAWNGLEAAATITGVATPTWIRALTWADPDRGLVWRADELTMLAAPIVGHLERAATLPGQWWNRLRGSLTALADHPTRRVGISQAHLTTRLAEVFSDRLGASATVVDEWAVAHTDLHWGNVSTAAELIDWESWGRAPRGLDAACLWQASLPDRELASRVRREFADDLDTRSGRLSLLLQCANAIRAARRRGTPTSLSGPAEAAAEELLLILQH